MKYNWLFFLMILYEFSIFLFKFNFSKIIDFVLLISVSNLLYQTTALFNNIDNQFIYFLLSISYSNNFLLS